MKRGEWRTHKLYFQLYTTDDNKMQVKQNTTVAWHGKVGMESIRYHSLRCHRFLPDCIHYPGMEMEIYEVRFWSSRKPPVEYSVVLSVPDVPLDYCSNTLEKMIPCSIPEPSFLSISPSIHLLEMNQPTAT